MQGRAPKLNRISVSCRTVKMPSLSVLNCIEVCRNEKCLLDIPFWGFKSVFKILYKGHGCSLPKGPIVPGKLNVKRFLDFFEAAVSWPCCLYLSPT